MPLPLRLAIVIGTTGEARFGEVLAQWVAGEADRFGSFSVGVLDLLDPVAVPRQPLPGARPGPEMAAFRQAVGEAEAYIIVTPEYNHGYPAGLKHAIDQTSGEWAGKPIAYVSYGGMSGGLRAVEQLRQVMVEMHAVNIREGLSFHGARRTFGEDGRPLDLVPTEAAAQAMLKRLAWWARVLRKARAEDPYWA